MTDIWKIFFLFKVMILCRPLKTWIYLCETNMPFIEGFSGPPEKGRTLVDKWGPNYQQNCRNHGHFPGKKQQFLISVPFFESKIGVLNFSWHFFTQFLCGICLIAQPLVDHRGSKQWGPLLKQTPTQVIVTWIPPPRQRLLGPTATKRNNISIVKRIA